MILRTPFTNRLSILAPPDRLHAAACSDRLGEFILALSLNLNEKIQPITVALNKFSGQYGTRWNEMMAVSTTDRNRLRLPATIHRQRNYVGSNEGMISTRITSPGGPGRRHLIFR